MKTDTKASCIGQILSTTARLLWAKSDPPKSLWCHILDSGLCAGALCRQAVFQSCVRLIATHFGLSFEEAVRLICYMAALHDIGKAGACYQKKNPQLSAPMADWIAQGDYEKDFRHEKFGEQLFRKTIAPKRGLSRQIGDLLATSIRLHHQGKHGKINIEHKAQAEWDRVRNELEEMAFCVFRPPLHKLTACVGEGAVALGLTALVILSDWIASSQPFESLDTRDDAAYMALSRRTAARAVRDYGLHSRKPFPIISGFTDMWPKLTRPRPTQEACLRHASPDAELTLIESPMGEGKTEAALYLAAQQCNTLHKQGVYVALPTAATSNQMHGRIEELFTHIGIPPSRLMHGMAWLMDEARDGPSTAEDKEEQAAWLAPLRKAMLSESAVGTVDQAMMAAMRVKYGCLRMLGLTGKVLVIDEVHAYDAYMSTIIYRLLAWCRALHIPVILLSATLPTDKRSAILRLYGVQKDFVPSPAYPLITQAGDCRAWQIPVEGSEMKNAYRFKTVPLMAKPKEIAELAVQKTENGGCLCVLLNSVKQVRRVYQALVDLHTEGLDVRLFHARFKAKYRDEVEKKCLRDYGKDAGENRPKRAVLVCSQVVEQSLDLDFDGMITELAPIDLLLQRAGRVHRHMGRKRYPGMETPIIEVLVPAAKEDYDESKLIYAPWLLDQTRAFLGNEKQISVPGDIRESVDAVYKTPEDVLKKYAEWRFCQQSEEEMAEAGILQDPQTPGVLWGEHRNVFDMEDDENSTWQVARTRLGDASLRMALLPERLYQAAVAAPHDKRLARTVMEQSFSMRAPKPEPLPPGAADGQGYLKGVLLLRTENETFTLGVKMIRYDQTLGALMEGE